MRGRRSETGRCGRHDVRRRLLLRRRRRRLLEMHVMRWGLAVDTGTCVETETMVISN